MTQLAPLGVQLYSLREEIAKDVEPVLNKLAEIGYAGVEPYGGIDHKKAAPILKNLGLEVPSMHASLPLGDDRDLVLEQAAAYGIKHLVCPWRPPEEFTTVDGIKKVCDLLNQANAVAQENGYTFGYHNHWFEFEMVDGRLAYDIMLENLDPAVFVEVDTYWVKVAGTDPAALIEKLGARAPLLHIKDGSGKREDGMVAAGNGVMNIPDLVKASGGNATWLIVELDRCDTDMMTAVEDSYKYMVAKGLGRGR